MNNREAAIQQHLRTLNTNWKFRLFLFLKLPAAWFMGIRVKKVTKESGSVIVPYSWFSKNPFRSVYFAAQNAAAELSTGVLATAAIQGDVKVSMLVTKFEAEFFKKATSAITFTCEEGDTIFQAVEEAIATGEGRIVRIKTTGVQKTGEKVSEMYVTWSFKRKAEVRGQK